MSPKRLKTSRRPKIPRSELTAPNLARLEAAWIKKGGKYDFAAAAGGCWRVTINIQKSEPA